MVVNFAARAHNHNWELDPLIRSLLDTDFYKLLMLQFIWKLYSKIRVSFSLFNRTSSVRLADMFATKEIVEQLEHVRKLQFRKSELVWLAGNTFYGHPGIFERVFLVSSLACGLRRTTQFRQSRPSPCRRKSQSRTVRSRTGSTG
jgi:nicotinate phosphoribosyltransferase